MTAGPGRGPGDAQGWDHAADLLRHAKAAADLPVVAPGDEGLHAPGPEPLWSESYYFDAVSDDGELGLYVRLARLPNQASCLYTAAIVGPGRPAVLVVEERGDLPDVDGLAQDVATHRFRASQNCVAPLERFEVRLTGLGEAYEDHGAPLTGESGRDVEVTLDLQWQTDGVPYRWRVLNRYEIPCRVTGTVQVGGESISFSGFGQRDHSFGVRDWWSDEWMWSAFRLNDGTRTHAVTLPALPGRAVGYLQREGSVTEILSGHSDFVDGEGGLPSAAWIDTEPGGRIDVEPLAYGALLMTSRDGRVSHFPRAMARVRTADGRGGMGWIEWNRVQPTSNLGRQG